MADPHAVTPDALEILIARDLRKAGLVLGRIRRRGLERPQQGPNAGPRAVAEASAGFANEHDFRLALSADLTAPDALLLIECWRRTGPLGASAVREHAGRVRDEEPAERAHAGLVVCTGGFAREAVDAAAEAPLVLLRVADARAAFDASGWGPRGQYPPWLPAHVLELATPGPAGAPFYRMLEPGSTRPLLRALGLSAD